MITIREVQVQDKAFWFALDNHLSFDEFDKKVRDKMAYVLLENDTPVGLLRYNFFWDNIPFCTMLIIEQDHHHRGFGKALMGFWEQQMKSQGYDMVLISTQVNETAQHFYRQLGYKDCGGLIMDLPNHQQPMEMFLSKAL